MHRRWIQLYNSIQLPKIASGYGPARKVWKPFSFDSWTTSYDDDIAWDLGRTRCHNTAFQKLPGQDKIIANGSNKHIPTNLQRTYQFHPISKENMVLQAICHPLCYLAAICCYIFIFLSAWCSPQDVWFIASKLMVALLRTSVSPQSQLSPTHRYNPPVRISGFANKKCPISNVNGEDFTWEVGFLKIWSSMGSGCIFYYSGCFTHYTGRKPTSDM